MLKLIRLSLAVMTLMCVSITALSQNVLIHIVKRGETLSSIAKMYGTTEQEIIRLNKNAKNFIYAGMELTLPTDSKQESEVVTDRAEIDRAEIVDAPQNIVKNETPAKEPKSITPLNYSGLSGSYMASFDYAGRGYYMIGGSVYTETVGVEFFSGTNLGLVESDYSGVIFMIGPNYGYALDKVLFSASLDFVGVLTSNGSALERKRKHIDKEYNFNWGIALEPRITFKLWKIFPWVGLPVQWANGSGKLSVGFHIGVGFDI